MSDLVVVSSQQRKDTFSTKRLLEGAAAKKVDVQAITLDELESVQLSETKIIAIRSGVSTITPELLAWMRKADGEGVRVINTPRCYELCASKYSALMAAKKVGVPVASTFLLDLSQDSQALANQVATQLAFPCIIKSTSGARGANVHKCDHEEEVIRAIDVLKSENPLNHFFGVIAQEFIGTSAGQDVRVMVVGKKILGTMRRFSSTGFKSNLAQGAISELYELNADLEKVAHKCIEAFEVELAAIDFLFGAKPGEYYFNEVNLFPGFEGFEQATGIDVVSAFLHYACGREDS